VLVYVFFLLVFVLFVLVFVLALIFDCDMLTPAPVSVSTTTFLKIVTHLIKTLKRF